MMHFLLALSLISNWPVVLLIAAVMPFGKFKGWQITELPDDYLSWLAGLDSLRWPFDDEIQDELQRRKLERKSRRHHRAAAAKEAPLSIPADSRSTAQEIITTGYRVLSLRNHPDKGGSHEKMIELNAAIQALRELIGEDK